MRGVSRMDAAAKPPWTDSRRPRNPTPPRHPTECRSGFGRCRCRCIEQVQGAALPKPSPTMTAVTCPVAPRWRKSRS
ncbi:hypothetical protein B9Y61_19750 [Stenotrophomonas maltophilia]|nr:hypothetical protein B9Y61_19750 [Stenotrophomonas maltophilia]